MRRQDERPSRMNVPQAHQQIAIPIALILQAVLDTDLFCFGPNRGLMMRHRRASHQPGGDFAE
jgi:hypothetical protein